MSCYVTRDIIQRDLKNFFASFSEEICLIHTDIVQWGFFEQFSNEIGITRDKMLGLLFELLSISAFPKHIVFPLFNYDYGKTRVYDVLNDKCQVGVLNEYVRRQMPEKRTRTPIFNFIEWPTPSFSLLPNQNPFGEDSFWNELCRRNGRICFLGVGLRANTFSHYIEDSVSVGYRYDKPMPGVICFGEEINRIDFYYRVRPQIEGIANKDWGRLESDLKRDRLLSEHALGSGKILSFNAKEVKDYWIKKLQMEEFYFLSDASIAKVQEVQKVKGYPFTYENLE